MFQIKLTDVMGGLYIEEIKKIVNEVLETIEMGMYEYFDMLIQEKGTGSMVKGEKIEIALPTELAEAWLKLEEPSDPISLCKKWKEEGQWQKVWLVRRPFPFGRNYFIIFRA